MNLLLQQTLPGAIVFSADVNARPWLFRETNLYAWDGRSKQPLWTRAIPNDVFLGTKLIVRAADIAVTFGERSGMSTFVGINPSNGLILWQTSLTERTIQLQATSRFVCALTVSKEQRNLVVIEAETGELIGRLPVDGSQLAVTESAAFVSGIESGVWQIVLPDLALNHVLHGLTTALATVADRVYLASIDQDQPAKIVISYRRATDFAELGHATLQAQSVQRLLPFPQQLHKLAILCDDNKSIALVDLAAHSLCWQRQHEHGWDIVAATWLPSGLISLWRPGDQVSKTEVLSLDTDSGTPTIFPAQISCEGVFWSGAELLLCGARGIEVYADVLNEDSGLRVASEALSERTFILGGDMAGQEAENSEQMSGELEELVNLFADCAEAEEGSAEEKQLAAQFNARFDEFLSHNPQSSVASFAMAASSHFEVPYENVYQDLSYIRHLADR